MGELGFLEKRIEPLSLLTRRAEGAKRLTSSGFAKREEKRKRQGRKIFIIKKWLFFCYNRNGDLEAKTCSYMR